MKITRISTFKVSGIWTGPTSPPGDRQTLALDIYPEFNQHQSFPAQPGSSLSAVYVEIHTDSALSGIFGPIERSQAYLIQTQLARFLIGRDPLAVETLTDQMLRMHRHGRSGMYVTAISSVDCALWDLKGKILGLPVYRLLGGPTRPEVPAYASMLGRSVEPEQAAQTALEIKSQGFSGQKWFFRWGPSDGMEGMARNLAMARAVRAALGLDYFLAFDAFMGWDEPYAIRMVTELAPLLPAWMEEPIPPERVGSLARIRAASSTPLATGEHVYTRWQVKELLEAHAVDWLQTDPDWTGGISEQVKICTLASAFNIPVVAHGHSLLPALHIAGAQPPDVVPMVEYLLQHQENKQFFHKTIYRPQTGKIRLPEAPGLGIELDEQKISSSQELTYEES